MRLRTQVALGIVVVASLVVGLLLAVLIPRTRTTFAALERDEIEQDIARARNAILAEIDGLVSTADDWGAWDDTVEFIRGEAPDYVERNVLPAVFENLQLDFMAFFDVTGALVYAQGYNLESSEQVEVPPAVLEAVSRVRAPMDGPDKAGSYAGVLDLGGTFALVAVRSVLSSLYELPSAGTLAIGRILTPEAIGRLAERLELPIEIEPLPTAALPGSVTNSFARGETSAVWHLSDAEAAGGYLLMDTGGDPALLSFTTPRTTYQLGVRTLRFLFGALLAALAVLAVGFHVFLNVRVLARTARLSADVSRIATSDDPTQRVEVKGRDEIGNLESEINDMLASIASSRDALARSERRYHSLFASSPDPIYITKLDGTLVDVNQAFIELFGYTREEAMGIPAERFYLHPEDRDAFKTAIEKTGFVVGFPAALVRKDGTHVHCLLTSAVEESSDGSGQVYQGIIRDVTELLRQQEKLEYLATHDPLTGLLTRGALDQVLKLEIARTVRNLERLAVFYLDLDRFKEVNDTLGHAAGDRLLQAVAARLRESLRASDAVARLGGDEFVALLPGIDTPQDAEKAAEKVLGALRRAFRVNDGRHDLSASIGIALCPDDGDSPTHLLRKADAAMYTVKAQGRNGWRRFGREQQPPSCS
jgi:diguanylate cyclase (GGDEF)-like protein/PAS domain S-box-containing protein